jgi:hypothetical protein
MACDVARLRKELGTVLFDPDEPPAPDLVAVRDTATFSDVQRLLAKYFSMPGAPNAITLMAEGERLGVVSRKSLGPPGMTAGTASGSGYELGGGERLGLPGLSSQYKLLKFRCGHCPAEIFGIHYDARSLPACERGHHQWEYRRED